MPNFENVNKFLQIEGNMSTQVYHYGLNSLCNKTFDSRGPTSFTKVELIYNSVKL